MVRAFGFCLLFMMVGMAIMILACSSSSSSYSFSDKVFHGSGNCKMSMTHNNRKLKEKSSVTIITAMQNKGNDKMNLEDYHPIDPAPSSRASIRYGPIEHGSPLIPYIPKPPPPDRPSIAPSPPSP